MTKRLILIRHAKSAWNAPVGDHARLLNGRGERNATAMGAWLANKGHIPNHIYCSDAARTQETSARILLALKSAQLEEPEITYVGALYHSPPEVLMQTLRKAQGTCVALVAHNPGIAFFASQIVEAEPDHPRFFDYPTCATLVCDFPVNDWAEAAYQSAKVIDFVVPDDLEND